MPGHRNRNLYGRRRLIAATAGRSRFGDIPVVHGMPFVSGVGVKHYSKNSVHSHGVTYV